MKNKIIKIIPFFLLIWELLSSPKYLDTRYLNVSYYIITKYISYIPYGRIIVLLIMFIIIPFTSFFCSLELAYRERKNKLLLFLYIMMTAVSILMIPLSLMLFIMCLCLEK